MPEHQYNTFWPRFWAGCIDWLIFLPLPFIDAWFYSQEPSDATTFIYYTLVTALGFPIYSILMHGKYGQTIGKMIMKVQVRSLDQDRLGYKKAFLRDSVIVLICFYYIFLYASVLWLDADVSDEKYDLANFAINGWFLLEVTTMLTNDKRRAVHDFIAGSVVIRLD